MTKTKTFQVIALLALSFSTSCARVSSGATATSAAKTKETAVGFINRVWRVSASSLVSPSSIYVFLSDGTLLTTSPLSKATLSMWAYRNGSLTFVEDAHPYKVDILKLDQTEFRIRVHGQDAPFELAMAPAEQLVLE